MLDKHPAELAWEDRICQVHARSHRSDCLYCRICKTQTLCLVCSHVPGTSSCSGIAPILDWPKDVN